MKSDNYSLITRFFGSRGVPDTERRRSILRPGRFVFGLLLAGTVAAVNAAAVFGQTVRPYAPTSAFDAYGNAGPQYVARRQVGNFQNPVQWAALQGIQEFGLRRDRRDGLVPFALTSDVFARRRTTIPSIYQNPFLMGRLPLWQQPALAPESAFQRRPNLREGVDIRSMATQRYALLAARSGSGPVRQALSYGFPASNDWGGGATYGSVAAQIGRTPFLVGEDQEEVPASAQRLDERLRAASEVAYNRVRSEAWSSFRDGAYHRAARAFQTASELQPADGESRIGQVFSHLALGAMRTASVAFRQWIGREQNPFRYSLDMKAAFGELPEGQRVRLSVLVGSQDASEPALTRAMRIVVLWYLGEREEAMRLAARLARDEPGSDFADWPARMRLAEENPVRDVSPTGSSEGTDETESPLPQ